MSTTRLLPKLACVILGWIISGSVYAALTDISSVPLNTFTATSSSDVKPNVLFILDDSGSMDWDYMPDWANDNSPPPHYYRNSAFNGVAYNPAIRYTIPVMFNADGSLNTTLYPSMTGVSASTGGDGAATAISRNWKAVPNDGFGVQDTSTSNLVDKAFSYTSLPGEYCTSNNLRTCTPATAPTTVASVDYNFPAKLRWCNSTALTTCKATYDTTYNKPRLAIPSYATLTVSGSVSTSVGNVTVNGQKIMADVTVASTISSTVASRIAAQINLCSHPNPVSTSCEVYGYTATVSGSVVSIFAPSPVTYVPVVIDLTASAMTVTPTAFVAGSVPGENLRTTITSSITSYAYPGSLSKAPARTDCAGTTCTYEEEMTNYANWWAYYHTRMQMMKTASSQAFSKLDSAQDMINNESRFRVGYMTINNNKGTDFLNLKEFKTTHKNDWYKKFLSSNPNNSTPLREALADAGRLYSGKLNGSSFNGVTVTDPLQYSCQQNYTILSTDGFWNGNAGYKMDGSTSVGNQDAALPRPMADGGSATIQTRTSTLQGRTVTNQLQSRTKILQKQITQLQKSTSNLQSETAQLQRSTSSDSGATWSGWSDVTSCKWDTSGSGQTRCQYLAYTAPVNVASCTSISMGTSTSNGTTWYGPARKCTYTAWSAPVGVSTCTAVAQDLTSTHTVAVATQCNTVVTTPYADATATCTVSTVPDASGFKTQCQYTAWSVWANAASCTPAAASGSSPYTVLTATECNTVTTTGSWANVASCTVSATQDCQYTAWTPLSNVGSCTAAPQSAAPNYSVATARECTSTSTGGTSNTLADVAAYYYGTDLRSSVAADGTGTCTGPIISPATTANDLCANNVPANGRDVATTQHMTTFTLGLGAQGAMVFSPTYWSDASGDFYDVWKGTTANASAGICGWQTSGQCNWPTPADNSINNIDDLWHTAINGRGSYFSATDPLTLSTGLSSTLATIINTPKPGTAAAAASSNPNISSSDNYVFSSSYKSVDWYGELIRQQLNPTTAALTAPQWSAMTLLDCAVTPWQANTSYVIGNAYSNGGKCYKVAVDYVSGATFDTLDTGSTARVVDVNGVDVVAASGRTIYTNGGSSLIPFTWSELVTAGLDNHFTGSVLTFVSSTTGLSQFCSVGVCLTAAEQTNVTNATGGAAGENLVNFLRGERSNEGTFYRSRIHVLGDIVTSEGRYVKQPLFNYEDLGFIAYRDSMATRQGMVYVAANDGMLHAFNATSGQEAWAYIPGLVLPDIYRLADKNYSNQHQYFVDGTPEVGEICPLAPASCDATEWKTILVGGLNSGGKGFYALDITDPAAPVLLWEISNATTGFVNLGYAYSNPRITKLKDGTWVVIFASGYNNADGMGHLYIVNAHTGALIRDISNGTGTAASPSGLARISAHAPLSDTNNTSSAVYGGDMFGNLWRFDINNDIGAAGYDAHLLVTLKDAGGTVQPITAKSTVTTITASVSGVSTAFPVIYVGTGRYLGVSDLSNTQTQSFYAVKDKSDTTTFSSPHTAFSGFVQQVLTDTTCPTDTPSDICSPGQEVRTVTNNTVDWGVKNGWYFDFLTGGERAATDSSLGLGTLVFTTITPKSSSADACNTSGGTTSSFSCAVDYLTGGAVSGSNGVACVSLGAGVATRPVLVELPDGTVLELIRISGGADDSIPDTPGGTTTGGSDMGDTDIKKPAVASPSAGGTRRVSWRKLLN